MDLDAQLAVVALVDVLEFIGRDYPVGEFDAGEDLFLVFFREGMVQDHLVDLLLIIGRVSEALGHLAVVGEHQDAGGVLVQPAHGEHPRRAALEEVHHGLLRVRVAGGRDVALGLVHDDVHLLLALEALSVEADVVGEDVDLGAQFGHHFAVHGDDAALDERVGLPAGADAGVGDVFVQADDLLDRGLRGIVVGPGAAADLRLAAEHFAHALVGAGALLVGLAAGLGAEGRLSVAGLAGTLAVRLALGARAALNVGTAFAVGAVLTGRLAVAVGPALAGGLAAIGSVLALRTLTVGTALALGAAVGAGLRRLFGVERPAGAEICAVGAFSAGLEFAIPMWAVSAFAAAVFHFLCAAFGRPPGETGTGALLLFFHCFLPLTG